MQRVAWLCSCLHPSAWIELQGVGLHGVHNPPRRQAQGMQVGGSPIVPGCDLAGTGRVGVKGYVIGAQSYFHQAAGRQADWLDQRTDLGDNSAGRNDSLDKISLAHKFSHKPAGWLLEDPLGY